jgi:hypothetical protein
MKTKLHPLLRPLLLIISAATILTACQKEIRLAGDPAPDHSLTVTFKPVVDADDLVFGDTYNNTWGEPYTVSMFKFYICKIRLYNTDSGTSYDVNKDEYFLVNFADNNSTVLKLSAVARTYNRIGFVIGVDSIRNVSGAQTGALDPGKGMFWTWSSGYIMAKLEGTSTASTIFNKQFEFHVGGFAGPDNVIKEVALSFPLGQAATLQANKSSSMTITANVNAWFFNPNDIEIAVNPICTSPGPLARQIAENYIKMFTVTDFVNQ